MFIEQEELLTARVMGQRQPVVRHEQQQQQQPQAQYQIIGMPIPKRPEGQTYADLLREQQQAQALQQ